MDIVYELNSKEINSVQENGKRICFALIVLDLLNKISHQLFDSEFDSDDINIILSLLILRPDLSKGKKFPDLNDVTNFIPHNYRKHIADVLARFIKKILPSNHLDVTHWVYVMPLMHALDGKLDKLAGSEEVKWMDDRVQLYDMKPNESAILK